MKVEKKEAFQPELRAKENPLFSMGGVGANTVHNNYTKGAKFSRRLRRARQRVVRKILKAKTGFAKGSLGKQIGSCREVNFTDVEMLRGEAAYYQGLVTCQNFWLCPFCSAKRAEQRREEVNGALAVARQDGKQIVLLTFTMQHRRGEQLAELLEVLQSAYSGMRQSPQFRKIQFCGLARALELTWGEANGWHPHFHVVAILDAESPEAALEAVEPLRAVWVDRLQRRGRDGAEDRAFDARGGSAAGDYITKWGVAEELTLSGVKEAKNGGLSQWDFLDRAAQEPRFAEIWWEFAQATRGKRLLQMNEDFKQLASRFEEVAGEPEVEPEFVMDFEDWSAVKDRQVKMLEAAESCADIDAARVAIAVAMHNRGTDRDLPLEPEGEVIEEKRHRKTEGFRD